MEQAALPPSPVYTAQARGVESTWEHGDPGRADSCCCTNSDQKMTIYSILARSPSPYGFLFTNDSGKLNVHVDLM